MFYTTYICQINDKVVIRNYILYEAHLLAVLCHSFLTELKSSFLQSQYKSCAAVQLTQSIPMKANVSQSTYDPVMKT